MSRADIAITTIFLIVLAVISIFLLLSIFAVKLPFFSKELYCKTFFHIQKSALMPSGIRIEEDYCVSEQALTKLIIVDHSVVAKQAAASAVGCWKLSEQGLANVPILCTALVVRINESVSFGYDEIKNILKDNNIKDFFDYETNLSVADIRIEPKIEKTILVEYDNSTRTVKIS